MIAPEPIKIDAETRLQRRAHQNHQRNCFSILLSPIFFVAFPISIVYGAQQIHNLHIYRWTVAPWFYVFVGMIVLETCTVISRHLIKESVEESQNMLVCCKKVLSWSLNRKPQIFCCLWLFGLSCVTLDELFAKNNIGSVVGFVAVWLWARWFSRIYVQFSSVIVTSRSHGPSTTSFRQHDRIATNGQGVVVVSDANRSWGNAVIENSPPQVTVYTPTDVIIDFRDTLDSSKKDVYVEILWIAVPAAIAFYDFGNRWIELGMVAFCGLLSQLAISWKLRYPLMHMILYGTVFPVWYGVWISNAFRELVVVSKSKEEEDGEWLAPVNLLLVAHSYMSLAFFNFMGSAIQAVSARYLFVRLLLPAQITCYALQYAIFGFTSWSIRFVLMVALTNVHNIASATGLYSKILMVNQKKEEQNSSQSLNKLLELAYLLQMFAQDTAADVMSCITLTALIALGCATEPFDSSHLLERLGVMVGMRVVGWVVARSVFVYRIRLLALHPDMKRETRTLLTEHFDTLNNPPLLRARLLRWFEDDYPTLMLTGATGKESISSLLQFQNLLQPSTIRKYWFYTQSALLLLLMSVTSKNGLPVRYAWL